MNSSKISLTLATNPNSTPLERRSDAVDEIISARPGFTSRWALAIFLILLLLLLACTWFITYPDIILTSAKLTATNAPTEIVPRQDGKLVKLWVKNEELVEKDQVIGWIESTADHQNVIALSSLLDKAIVLLSKNETEQVSYLFQDRFYKLGELQTAYQHFISSWQQFNDYLVNGYYYKRKKALIKEAAFLKNVNATLSQQKELTEQDIQLTQESFDSSHSLYSDKVISKEDLRQQKSRLVNRQLSLPQLTSEILSNENQQAGKEKEIDELEHNIGQQKIIFQEELQTIASLVNDWKVKYLIRAPARGKVAFLLPLQEDQFIQAGKVLGFVNPFDSHYYAQVTLPQGNLGKVAVGQRVQLRFEAYPYQEFGYVKGRLNYISRIPSDSGFLANIELPDGLFTNHHQEVQYRYGLRSQALIITRNTRLLQRFYFSIVRNSSR